MLKKLLRYDLKEVFRYWWIAVIISTTLSVAGGFASLMESYDGWIPEVILSLLGGTIFLAYCSYFALMVLTMVLLFIRFYKNFFSDEGYLTFTLPVHRKDLLLSKVITGFLAMTASLSVCGLNRLLMSCIEGSGDPENGFFLSPVFDYIARGIQNQGGYFWITLAENLLLILVGLALAVVFLYFCVTFGCMIVKKGKVITSIAIFYGASSVATAIAVFLLFFGAFGTVSSFSPEVPASIIAVLFRAGLAFYLATWFCLLYAVQYWMLDKKLNLA